MSPVGACSLVCNAAVMLCWSARLSHCSTALCAEAMLMASRITLLQERIASRLRNFTEAYRDIRPSCTRLQGAGPTACRCTCWGLRATSLTLLSGQCRAASQRWPIPACPSAPTHASSMLPGCKQGMPAPNPAAAPVARHVETAVSSFGGAPVPTAAATAASAVFHSTP